MANNTNKLSLLQRQTLYTLSLILLLFIFSYFLGVWQNGGGGGYGTALSAAPTSLTLQCQTLELDFTTHHTLNHTIEGQQQQQGLQSNSVQPYPPCEARLYGEHTPCEDTARSLRFSRDRLVYRERHCPSAAEALKCRVPAPHGYRAPFPWPRSRDAAWYANVPHKELTVEKAAQNWITFDGERFRFPGGGTMFPNGAAAYIDDIGRLIDLKSGSVRTAIDTGCGVASFGAYLLSRNILTMSFAPRDTHEAQVQFALERGVPALIGVLASKRLPYPSRAFDMAHCSRCLIPWAQYDGIYLMEVDRILRPGGYWVLSGPPINWRRHWKGWQRTREDLNGEQRSIEEVANSLCWKKIVEKGDIAIWQKPINHMTCKDKHSSGQTSPLCTDQDPDRAWYTKMETCLTPLPKVSNDHETSGGELSEWPKRLNSVPPRISQGTMEGILAENFLNDSKLWKKRLSHYKSVNYLLGKPGRYRNLLDMNANLAGFAAALQQDPVWVMNVVPVDFKVDTLGVIYERGLIGTYQDWCEAMSTYPRTYDLIHADSVFSLYKDRCEMEDILLEMDRILRPEGNVIIRDDVDLLVKIKRVADRMEWESRIVDHEDGPHEREKLLFAFKKYWTASAQSDQKIIPKTS